MCTVGEDLRDQREIGKLLSSHFEICRLPRYLPISQMISQMFITLSFGPVYGCLEQGNRYHLKPRARAVSSLKIQPIFCHIWQFKWSGFQPIWNALNCLLFTAVQFVEATDTVYFFCQVEITISILLYFHNMNVWLKKITNFCCYMLQCSVQETAPCEEITNSV